MKAQGLRIGNLLSYDGIVVQVSNIGSNGFETTKDGLLYGRYNLESYDPIELTEQWLIDFGFEKFGDNSSFYLGCYEKGFIFDRYDSTQARIWWRGRYLGICQRLGSVHQLQNLYFALTGEELTLR